MEPANNYSDSEHFINELKDCSENLVDQLQQNNFEAASKLIQHVVEARDLHLFNSVGKLTRALHDSLVNFDVGVDDCEGDKCISDASDRLNYVINLTQEAADKTMDLVEVAVPLASGIRAESKAFKEEWERLRRKEMSKAEFASLYSRIDEFWLKIDTDSVLLHENLQAILLEQGYQDLTGQVLKKVISLVKDVEVELVNLMRIAGQVEDLTGIANTEIVKDAIPKDVKTGLDSEAEGPQINKDKPNVVANQDDVDDLLSSLGF